VIARKKTEFLSLELGGSLTLKTGSEVVARNELRISSGGQLKIEGASVESARWVDNEAGGTLKGYGTIHSSLYNEGTMILTTDTPLVVHGPVHLSGKLEIMQTQKTKGESRFSVLKGKAITGGFDNRELLIGGRPYGIKYSESEVYLVAK
jgi:hypothetical protein